MPEYVEIAGGVGEILAIANGLRGRGETLADAVAGVNREIEAHEQRADTFPSDQFTDPFLATYRQAAPAADGHDVPANQAVRDSAAYCARKLADIGGYVATAMVNYDATDQDGGADIAASAPPR